MDKKKKVELKDEKQEVAILRIEEEWQERKGLTYLFLGKTRVLLTDFTDLGPNRARDGFREERMDRDDNGKRG